MPRGHIAEDIRNHTAVLVQDIEWLEDAFGEEVIDEVAEVLVEMRAAIDALQEVAKQVEAGPT